jgi:hypothetical protein
MTDELTTATGQIIDLATFIDFLDGFAGGELAAELTGVLARSVKATTAHGSKSSFTIRFDVDQVDESMWGQLVISHKVTEKPARQNRAGMYQVDVESGRLSLA